jgi:hypothetical protein
MSDHDHTSSGPGDGRTSEAEDELVSAVLDGVASDEERALVEADPRLTARLAAFSAVRSTLGTPAPDRSVAPPPAGPARQRPRPRRSPSVWIGAAAAALVLVLGGVAVLDSRGGSGDEAASTAADTAGSDPSEADGSDGAAEDLELADPGLSTEVDPRSDAAAAASEPPTTVPSTTVLSGEATSGEAIVVLADLGSFATVDELSVALSARPPATVEGMSPCAATFAAAGARAEVTALVASTRVEAGRGPSGVVVVDPVGCRVLG